MLGKPLGSCLQRLAAGLRQRARGGMGHAIPRTACVPSPPRERQKSLKMNEDNEEKKHFSEGKA